mmetsp:Transcript_38189/g.71608  ORF Transcript_38189/g.71608 Transcript_38189/m.71608 type:complete len:601 (+) Transcript_38189:43-1845(+)
MAQPTAPRGTANKEGEVVAILTTVTQPLYVDALKAKEIKLGKQPLKDQSHEHATSSTNSGESSSKQSDKSSESSTPMMPQSKQSQKRARRKQRRAAQAMGQPPPASTGDIVHKDGASVFTSKAELASASTVEECQVCFEDMVDILETVQLPCGHRFCTVCIHGWFQCEAASKGTGMKESVMPAETTCPSCRQVSVADCGFEIKQPGANSMAEVQFTAAPNRDYEDVAQSGAGPPGSWARVVMNASVTSGAGNGSLTASSPAGAPSSISAHISCSQESVPTGNISTRTTPSTRYVPPFARNNRPPASASSEWPSLESQTRAADLPTPPPAWAHPNEVDSFSTNPHVNNLEAHAAAYSNNSIPCASSTTCALRGSTGSQTARPIKHLPAPTAQFFNQDYHYEAVEGQPEEADINPYNLRPDLQKTKLCRQFSEGHCQHGHRCWFAHGVGEQRHILANVESRNESPTEYRTARQYLNEDISPPVTRQPPHPHSDSPQEPFSKQLSVASVVPPGFESSSSIHANALYVQKPYSPPLGVYNSDSRDVQPAIYHPPQPTSMSHSPQVNQTNSVPVQGSSSTFESSVETTGDDGDAELRLLLPHLFF